MSLLSRRLRHGFFGGVGLGVALVGPVAVAAMGALVLWGMVTGEVQSPLGPLLYSLGMVTAALALSLPLALLVAVNLAEFGPEGRLGWALSRLLPWLRLVPAPVWGLIGLELGVGLLGLPGPLAVALALGAMLIPPVTLSVAQAIEDVPWEIREGGLALGASRPELVRSLLLPVAAPRLVEIALFTAARALGEAAILIMVSRPGLLAEGYIPALPTQVFQWLGQGPGAAGLDSSAAAGLLWLLVVGLCSAAFLLRQTLAATKPGAHP